MDFVFYVPSDPMVPHLAREALMACIADFFAPLNHHEALALAPCYLSKMFLKNAGVNGPDSWALFSFCGFLGLGMDIKFVSHCARPFQFSMDSLYIVLDNLPASLEFDATSSALQHISVRSHYGDATEVKKHIDEKIIAVHEASDVAKVHGGGLMKYASLIAQGWKLAPWLDAATMERYMGNRFQIDHPDREMAPQFPISAQAQRLNMYMQTHFAHPSKQGDALAFLKTLRAVVQRVQPVTNGCGDLMLALDTVLHGAAPRRNRRRSSSRRLDDATVPASRPVSDVPEIPEELSKRAEVDTSPVPSKGPKDMPPLPERDSGIALEVTGSTDSGCDDGSSSDAVSDDAASVAGEPAAIVKVPAIAPLACAIRPMVTVASPGKRHRRRHSEHCLGPALPVSAAPLPIALH
jgi:hypothetical protein